MLKAYGDWRWGSMFVVSGSLGLGCGDVFVGIMV